MKKVEVSADKAHLKDVKLASIVVVAATALSGFGAAAFILIHSIYHFGG